MNVANASFLALHDGVYLSPGFITNVAIDRYIEVMLPQPYSDCQIPNDWQTQGFSYLFNLILNSPYQYTQELCLDLCFQEQVVNVCSCNPYDFPFFNGIACQSNPSTFEADTICINNLTQTFLKGNYLIKKCLPICPLECNRTGFTPSLSMSQLNGDTLIQYIANTSNLVQDFVTKPINSENAKNSFVAVNVYYESLSYTYSEEDVACDWICLISNIGGTMGLFMGAGILSLAEIVEVLMELFFIFKEGAVFNSISPKPYRIDD